MPETPFAQRYMLDTMGEGTDDVDLVRRIASGDTVAMRVLYSRHHLRVHRFITGILRDRNLSEDLVNEVFLDVWRQAARFEARSSVSTWLLGISRFKALSFRRRRREDELDDDVAEAIPDAADTPETIAAKSDKAGELRRCIGALTPEHRMVVDLVYYHDKSVEEVAMILDIPEATVKTRMFYARKKLSELMAAAGIDRGWP